ncbi:MAG: hypothetical protein QOG52_1392 [Frankiaceae bacterium]|nr:hypothetical protein [Frankiaceae bacterium]
MPPKSAPRNVLLEELRWVHDKLRRDLATVRQLAAEVEAGAGAGAVAAQLRTLQAKGPLWQLKVNCLTYCQFVHGHHGHEDESFFPAIKRADPSLAGVVKRLMADHVKVSDLLDEIEAAARYLGNGDATARTRLSAAQSALSEHLLTHLAYEEDALGPVLATMSGRR